MLLDQSITLLAHLHQRVVFLGIELPVFLNLVLVVSHALANLAALVEDLSDFVNLVDFGKAGLASSRRTESSGDFLISL